ncbi:MAG: spore coat associated protein CotJA [Lachnospiraceae bacterium]|nr:spore coat associated protein CotJA [Lachnospiraceae bacterium]
MPLAMACVPWQRWREIYQPDEGLSCGTIFKELNLPFTGRRVCR